MLLLVINVYTKIVERVLLLLLMMLILVFVFSFSGRECIGLSVAVWCASDVTVIVVVNGFGDTSSNPEQRCLLFNCLGDSINVFFCLQWVNRERNWLFVAWYNNRRKRRQTLYSAQKLVSHPAHSRWGLGKHILCNKRKTYEEEEINERYIYMTKMHQFTIKSGRKNAKR